MDSPAHLIVDAPAAADTARPAVERRTQILFYSGTIIVAVLFISPAVGFHVIPLSFVLKNKLHLSANALATFTLWAGIPGYLSFAFGMVRDYWNPFGIGDRGYFVLFGALAAAVFAIFAFLPVSEPELLASALLGSFCFLFLWSAWNGLGSTIGQQLSMSGQISSLFPHLQPAVDQAGPDLVATTKANAKIQATLLSQSSPVISSMVKDGTLKVVAGYYDLASGAVSLVN